MFCFVIDLCFVVSICMRCMYLLSSLPYQILLPFPLCEDVLSPVARQMSVVVKELKAYMKNINLTNILYNVNPLLMYSLVKFSFLCYMPWKYFILVYCTKPTTLPSKSFLLVTCAEALAHTVQRSKLPVPQILQPLFRF